MISHSGLEVFTKEKCSDINISCAIINSAYSLINTKLQMKKKLAMNFIKTP